MRGRLQVKLDLDNLEASQKKKMVYTDLSCLSMSSEQTQQAPEEPLRLQFLQVPLSKGEQGLRGRQIKR